MTEPPPLGARVRIAYTAFEGNVVEVYEGSLGPQVVIEINYSEGDDPSLGLEEIRTTVVFPIADIELVAA